VDKDRQPGTRVTAHEVPGLPREGDEATIPTDRWHDLGVGEVLSLRHSRGRKADPLGLPLQPIPDKKVCFRVCVIRHQIVGPGEEKRFHRPWRGRLSRSGGTSADGEASANMLPLLTVSRSFTGVRRQPGRH
jgi:hypothetical protein